ncbi:hypothetical protein FEM48_Zijuj12G0205600 [Ziziphus jujuba var. spinosa]|uniref:Prefoldin subunit 3 n=1 Tax=Ziziphus jujuba var. spinosa TaxID=714518 RepID=A0A978UFE5_ZIZJJ|nr:hypothetical protein FEM48_Zijuj12G0205600 [Ziziphus jujuba var. spinosa]
MASSSSSSTSPGATERRGIPGAQFVEDVQTYLDQSGLDVNSALAFLQERSFFLFLFLVLSNLFDMRLSSDSTKLVHGFRYLVISLQQYKLVEMKLLAQQRDLQAKIPDIEKCLDVVATLQAKKGAGEALIADFEVSEGIYSQARIEDTDSVCLWLGANVMLEYSCEEATSLLQKNLENAKASLEVLVADLQFLRDQVTITQVTIARVYNWDVHQRRLRQASPAAKDS